MNLEQAQKLTTKNTLLSTTALLLFFILLLLIGETRGDFANGILFFLAGMINPIAIIFLIILYFLTYFLSRMATTEIIIKNKKTWQISLSMSILISLTTVIYFSTWAVIKMNDSKSDIPISGLIERALKLFFSTFFFEAMIWIWATTRLKKLKIDTIISDDYR